MMLNKDIYRNFVWAGLLTFMSAAAASGFSVIDTETTISGVEEDDVTVIDGATPPTVVDFVAPAYLVEGLEVFGISIINFRGGEVSDEVRMFDSSTINVTGGTLESGIIGFGNSTINILDVAETDTIVARETSVAAVSGGEVYNVWAQGQGTITLVGGHIYANPHVPGLRAEESGTIHVFGSRFNFPLGPLTDPSGTLTGFLADGQPISTNFVVTGNGSIVLVPEPSALVIGLPLLLFIFAIRRRRQRPWGT